MSVFLVAFVYLVKRNQTDHDFRSGRGGVGTDDKGQFIFTAMNGLRYLIRSHINIQNNQRHAEPLEIPADGDVSGVKLVITEAGGSCEKCRTWKRRKN